MLQRKVSPIFLVKQDTSKQCRIRHGLHVCQKNLLERVGRSGNLLRTCWDGHPGMLTGANKTHNANILQQQSFQSLVKVN